MYTGKPVFAQVMDHLPTRALRHRVERHSIRGGPATRAVAVVAALGYLVLFTILPRQAHDIFARPDQTGMNSCFRKSMRCPLESVLEQLMRCP